uniref:Secreted protein n=1 Tax=Arion vulgaris TaxID=1028688 RepID=A0A0B6YYT6_9EUPU
MRWSVSSFWNVCPSAVWLTRPALSSCILMTATTMETNEKAVKHIITYKDFLLVQQSPRDPATQKKPPLQIGETV